MRHLALVKVPDIIPFPYNEFYIGWINYVKSLDGSQVELFASTKMGIKNTSTYLDGYTIKRSTTPDEYDDEYGSITRWVPLQWVYEIYGRQGYLFKSYKINPFTTLIL